MRNYFVFILVFFCLASRWGVGNVFAANPVQIENAKPGNVEWHKFGFPSDVHDMEGYADKDSVKAGETIRFFVNANPQIDKSYKLTVYRLGWYGGLGARKVAVSPLIPSIKQVIPLPDPKTGMVQANWKTPYTLKVPKAWLSGVYVVTVIGNTSQKGQYIPFIVKDITRKADYVYQISTLTWQAYNGWGGKSLYPYNSNALPVASDTHPVGDAHIPARKVSFNRPYDDWVGLGLLISWEINMLYFLEREGFDVAYQTDVDTHVGDGGLLNYKALITAGHDEYWTKAMRDNIENAQKHGLGLGFFSANTAFWQVRLESTVAPLTNQRNRTIVGYKSFAAEEDPLATNGITNDDHLVTALWRDEHWANRPENELIGIMYGFWPVNGDIVASRSDPLLADGSPTSWVYSGTHVKVGTTFKGLLGYETERVYRNGKTPATLRIVASSPVPLSSVQYPQFPFSKASEPSSQMTVYTKPCTLTPCRNKISTVFATGSMQWAWGLDRYARPVNYENEAAKQVTRNVLARLVSAPLPI